MATNDETPNVSNVEDEKAVVEEKAEDDSVVDDSVVRKQLMNPADESG